MRRPHYFGRLPDGVWLTGLLDLLLPARSGRAVRRDVLAATGEQGEPQCAQGGDTQGRNGGQSDRTYELSIQNAFRKGSRQ